jgi:hypothetical protein
MSLSLVTKQPEHETAVRLAEGDAEVRVVHLRFEEIEASDCTDNRYGCTCISHEKCCGCIIQ